MGPPTLGIEGNTLLTFTAGTDGGITMSVAGQTDKSLEEVCRTWYAWADASGDPETLSILVERSSDPIAAGVRTFIEGRLVGKPPTTNLTGRDLQYQIAQAVKNRPR